MSTEIEIREERTTDREGVYAVNQSAFETEAEARIVDRLRDEREVQASVVAIEGPRVIGHALFSPARIEYASSSLAIGALGPVAVLPERQRTGIGSGVIRTG